MKYLVWFFIAWSLVFGCDETRAQNAFAVVPSGITPLATGFSITSGVTPKTFTLSNTLTFSGMDGSTLNIGAGGTLGTAAFQAVPGSNTQVIYNNAGVLAADSGLTYVTSGQLTVGSVASGGGLAVIQNTGQSVFRGTTPASGTQILLNFTNPGNTVGYFALDVNQLDQPVFDLAGESFFLYSSSGANYVTAIPNSGGVSSISTGAFAFSSSSSDPRSSIDTRVTRGGVATLQLGAADAAAPVAQTLGAQSVVAGGSGNVSGAIFTINGSKSTGSGCGDLIEQTTLGTAASTTQNALAAALTLKGCTQIVGINKHIAGLGSAPTAVAAGGTGSASLSTGANDVHGTVTGGTLSTSITITFVNAFANAPDCTVSSDGTIVPTSVATNAGAAGAATLVIGMSAATGAKYTYVCMGQ